MLSFSGAFVDPHRPTRTSMQDESDFDGLELSADWPQASKLMVAIRRKLQRIEAMAYEACIGSCLDQWQESASVL